MRRSAVIPVLCQTPGAGAMVRTAGLETRGEKGRGGPTRKAFKALLFLSPWKPIGSSDLVTQSIMLVCVRYSVATTVRLDDFDHSACRRLTLKIGTRLLSRTLPAYCVNGRALTIALLCRVVSSARRAMRSNYLCNHQHRTWRSCARKVGPNTQQVPDVRVRLRAAPPEGIWCGAFKLPDGQQGEDGRRMSAIMHKPGWSDFEGAMQ
jgi:hypothetical protein